MKKVIAAVATVFIAVALSVVAVAAPASAHTASLSGAVSCNTTDGSSTVTWTVTNNYNEPVTISASTDAKIAVGTTLASGPNTSKTFSETIAAPSAGKTATATLTFQWSSDSGKTIDYTQTGVSFTTQSVSSDCTAKNASAAIVDTAAGCGSSESVAPGTVVNATWGPLTNNGGYYHLAATSTAGHSFTSANGGTLSQSNTVDTFTGTLNPPLSSSSQPCRVASAAIVTTSATCQAPELIKEDAIKFASWTPITYKTSNGVTTYTAIATAQSGYSFPNGVGVSNNNTTLTQTGTVAGEITGHTCEDYIIVAWKMPSWVNSTTPTWPQTYVTSQEQSAPNLGALDSKLIYQCGVQYQVDIYYNSATTSSLIAGEHLDGPNTPPEDLIPGGWGVAYKLVQGPACAPVVTPSESDVCTAGGTITVHAATGVQYYLNGNPVDTSKGDVVFTGLHGTNTVTATAKPGYALTGYPPYGWTYTINSDCTATYASSGQCTSVGTVSQQSVTLNLVNNSGTSATFVVTSTDSTVTPTGSYIVPAHTTSQPVVGSTTSAGGTFLVSVNGAAGIPVTVNSFVGCILVTPADPTFTPLTCTGQTTNLGSISTDGNPVLVYTLTGPGQPVGGTVFPSLPNTPTISGLSAGVYTVTVSAVSGYILVPSSPTVYPVTVPLTPVNCTGTQQTPVVTFVAPTCHPNTANQAAAGFSTALSEVQGTITLPDDSFMTFTINGVDAAGNTTTIEPDGTYTVVATLKPSAIASGYTFGPSAQYTVSADGKTATFAAIAFTSACGLPTLASWHSGATGDPASCTANGAVGVITLVHGSDINHPTDETGKVTYTLVNLANNHTTNLGSTALTVNAAPGSYKVEAVPTDPADGLVGNPNVNNEIDYAVTIAAAAGSCGGLLAFTGGTIAWAGFALAGGMLFLGIAFMLIRRRSNRTAQ